jgi:hypothetical protein
MQQTLKLIFSAVVFNLCAAGPGAAGSSTLDFTIRNVPGYGAVYQVSGSGVNLQAENRSFQNAPFGQYDVTGNMFGRRLPPGGAIRSEDFGGMNGVQLDAAGIYARFIRPAGWPELQFEASMAPDTDAGSVLVLGILANYLPSIPGASAAPAGHSPTLSFTLRQFGNDSIQVAGAGVSNVRVDRFPWGQAIVTPCGERVSERTLTEPIHWKLKPTVFSWALKD